MPGRHIRSDAAGTTSYSDNPLGNLTSLSDAKSQTTNFSYDRKRLAQIQYADSTVTFGYDKTGNLTSYDDGVTSGSHSYNALNQKLSEVVNYGAFTKSFSYDYTTNGLKKPFTMLDGTAYEYIEACPERVEGMLCIA